MNIAFYGNTVGMAEWLSIHKQLMMAQTTWEEG